MTSPMGATGVLSMLLSGVGSVFGAIGSLEGGRYQQNMENYRSRVAQINAGIAGEQANTELAVGGIDALRVGRRAGFVQGETRAGIGAGGLNLGTGSAKQVLSSEAETGQFEQRTTLENAGRRAFAQRVSQFGDVAQAGLDVAAGQGAVTASKYDAITSVLGGATSVSDKWTKFAEAGDTPGPPTLYQDPNNPGGYVAGYG